MRSLTDLGCVQLKCSGEPDGCKRCLAKKIECHYPAPASSKRSGSTQSEAPLPTPSEVSQVESASDVTTTPSEDAVSRVASADTISDNDINFDFEISNFNTLMNSDEFLVAGEFSPPDLWQVPSDFTVDIDLGHPSVDVASWKVDDAVCDMWDAPSEKNPTATSIAETSDLCYACLIQAMKTHEAVETAVWAQRETDNDTHDILQKQKKATLECIELLECHRCSAQPAYVMMLLSICGKILETLDVVCRDFPLNESYPDQTNDRCTGQTGRLNLDGKLFRRQSVCGMGGTKRIKRHLDEEDELLVLQSLAKARVVKLDGLLNRLHKIISKHNWPAHESHIRQLKHHLTKRLEL